MQSAHQLQRVRHAMQKTSHLDSAALLAHFPVKTAYKRAPPGVCLRRRLDSPVQRLQVCVIRSVMWCFVVCHLEFCHVATVVFDQSRNKRDKHCVGLGQSVLLAVFQDQLYFWGSIVTSGWQTKYKCINFFSIWSFFIVEVTFSGVDLLEYAEYLAVFVVTRASLHTPHIRRNKKL